MADDAPQRALSRLRDPEGEALAALARLVVDEATATPLREIAAPRWIAGQIATALEAGTRGDHVRHWVERRIEAERERWQAEDRPLRAFVPEEAQEPLRKLLGRPYSPDEDLVHRIVDQAAIRRLVRIVLRDTVTGFRRRVTSVDDGLLGGMAGRAARRGRGLLGNVGKNLGGMAENIVGAVKEEVDTAFEGRVREFLDGATGEAVRTIAVYAADPSHADSLGELRLAILDVVLDTPLKDLIGEAEKLGPEDAVDVVVAALRSAVAEDDFVERTEERVARVLDEAGDGTLGAWLDEVKLREVWSETTTELVTQRLQAVVETDAFVTWWTALFA